MAPDSQTTDRKGSKCSLLPPEPEPEQLPCPRCDSTNTKFCYYNNYNFSQPRHFCKSCRRYWTHGGTLRDIPVGGGSRKNAKRSRTSIAASSGGSNVFPSAQLLPAGASQLLVPISADHGGSVPAFIGDGKMGGSFTSLNNSQALGGFGVGLEDVGFGLGRAVWPFTGGVEGSGNGGGSPSVTWQLENGGECFALPDLAISTPAGTVFK